MKEESFQKIQADLRLLASLKEVGATEEESLLDGIRSIPVNKIMECAQNLGENVLPAMEKKVGADHPNYVFYYTCYRMLLYAILLADRYDDLELLMSRLKIRILLVEKENEGLYAALQKYCTLQDIYADMAHYHIQKGIRDRAAELLQQKGPKTL